MRNYVITRSFIKRVSTIFVALKEVNPFSPFYSDVWRTPIHDTNDQQFTLLWERTNSSSKVGLLGITICCNTNSHSVACSVLTRRAIQCFRVLGFWIYPSYCFLNRTHWLHKIVIRPMYTLYYLLFNTVYIKNSPTCFELCYSSSSGNQLFITQAIDQGWPNRGSRATFGSLTYNVWLAEICWLSSFFWITIDIKAK
jgi:hypothetical protein